MTCVLYPDQKTIKMKRLIFGLIASVALIAGTNVES